MTYCKKERLAWILLWQTGEHYRMMTVYSYLRVCVYREWESGNYQTTNIVLDIGSKLAIATLIRLFGKRSGAFQLRHYQSKAYDAFMLALDKGFSKSWHWRNPIGMVDDFQRLGYLRVKRREIRVYCGTHARDSRPSLSRRLRGKHTRISAKTAHLRFPAKTWLEWLEWRMTCIKGAIPRPFTTVALRCLAVSELRSLELWISK